MRSGAQTLVLLAAPLTVLLLRELAEGPKRQAELRRAADLPAQTTLRAQLNRLAEIGAVEKRRRDRFPGVLEYDLTTAGRDLLRVAAVLERWLADAPDGALAIGSNAAKAPVRAFADAWSTAMLRALSAGPLSLTELDSVIGALSYPALERRLALMRVAGLVKARSGGGRSTPYAVTDWLRHGLAPLAAAIGWERDHPAGRTPPFERLDAETVFLLATPLLRPPADVDGRCRLAVEFPSARVPNAGVTVTVSAGGIESCTTRLNGTPDAWALGTPGAWLDAIVDGNAVALELGGDCDLARVLLSGLHAELFLSRPLTQRH